ncbi:TatD family hydrolase [Treponema pectinovorum]|uniref:TatD family hydrolase n=1 Tax=Treponema pectinovorum TaxID=164 RepID=UPI0011CBE865|nr:TatD family hydrolase [Treponema pectinovorum]
MKIFDSHLHLVPSASIPDFSSCSNEKIEYYGITCAFSEEEFKKQNEMINSIPKDSNIFFYKAFGIHPQWPDISQKNQLEKLLKEGKIDAIGECGFDFFTQEFKDTLLMQEECWKVQLEFAVEYEKPLIIHGRKCTNYFFRDVKLLKKVPKVIFHSWAGTYREALSLIEKNVDAYFSFGKPLINGKKSAIECVQKLPEKNILLETDSPYQALKGEKKTSLEDILRVYKKAFEIRGKEFFPLPEQIFKSPEQNSSD